MTVQTPANESAALTLAMEQAGKFAQAALDNAIEAAEKAEAADSTEAREHFKKQEAAFLLAFDSWRQAEEWLFQRIHARRR